MPNLFTGPFPASTPPPAVKGSPTNRSVEVLIAYRPYTDTTRTCIVVRYVARYDHTMKQWGNDFDIYPLTGQVVCWWTLPTVPADLTPFLPVAP